MPKKLNLNEIEVIQKYQELKSICKLAELFDVDKSTIARILEKNGIERNLNKSNLNEIEVIDNYKELKSICKIADIYNVNSSTIARILEKNGIERNLNKSNLNEIEVIDNYKELKSICKLADIYDVGKSTIARILEKNGIERNLNKLNLNGLEVIQKYQELKSIYKVAEIFDVSMSTIANILENNGIERYSKGKKSHGMAYSRTYRIWQQMKERCDNIKCNFYKNYGGRGIKVCERWYNFEHFLADMGECPDGMSIDRIDVEGDYTSENCRWASNEEQSRNRRNTVYLDIEGETKSLKEWYEEKDCGFKTYGSYYGFYKRDKESLEEIIKTGVK